MTREELKCDCNFTDFGAMPRVIRNHIFNKAYSNTQYCSWLYNIGDDVVVRTWAFKKRKNKPVEYTEVERKNVLSDGWGISKNIYLTGMNGYRVIYSEESNSSRYSSWYGYSYRPIADFDLWESSKEMGLCSPILNMSELFNNPKYQYCGFSGNFYGLFKYLRMYNEDPAVEYFGKMGVNPSKQLMNKCNKDRKFINFLRENAKDVNEYGVSATIYAYEHHISLNEAYKYLEHKRHCERRTSDFKDIQKIKPNRINLCKYIDDMNVGIRNYKDYWEACVNLGLDMKDTKNIYPKNFQRMHDLRINELDSEKAKQDAKERRSLYRRFRNKAAEYKMLEFDNGEYSVLIPESVKDLLNEGSKLHHCVGRMGYDEKMIKGECIIGFIRLNKQKDKPYVTVEYLTKSKKISQCYADHDSIPPQNIIQFADEWAEMVTEKLREG